METLRENRKIDISRARPKNRETRRAPAAGAQRAPAAGAEHVSAAGVSHTPAARAGQACAAKKRPHSAAKSAGTAPASGPTRQTVQAPAAKRRRSAGRAAAVAAACVLLVLVLAVGAGYLYVDSFVRESDLGSFDNVPPPAADSTAAQQSLVPPEFKGVRNILVLGLDYDDDDAVVRDKEHPNTDMILYVRLDGTAHTLTMLQFPRDIFVGQAGGAAGKINGILAANVDAGNGLGALKSYIEQNFGLPVNDYITIDLEALREMVDAFDGVAVYVPQDMRYYNPKTGALEGELLQGWHKLMGRECEFFLRYRQGLTRGDLDRLVMQRQFYAGLFRRLKTASVGDIVKLLPVAEYYIRTDISTLDLMSIAIEVSRMDSAGICIGRIPVYGTNERYYDGGLEEGTLPVVLAKEETAALLNEYFRPADQPILTSDLGTPDWPTSGGAAQAEMSTMGDVDHTGDGTPPDFW